MLGTKSTCNVFESAKNEANVRCSQVTQTFGTLMEVRCGVIDPCISMSSAVNLSGLTSKELDNFSEAELLYESGPALSAEGRCSSQRHNSESQVSRQIAEPLCLSPSFFRRRPGQVAASDDVNLCGQELSHECFIICN